MKVLLDTDTCIWLLRGIPEVRERLTALSPEDVAISAMNEAELRFGVLHSQHPTKHARSLEAFLAPIQVLPFDAVAAKVHAKLRLALKRTPIGERDLVIASVAVAHRLTLITHNQREFQRVPGLKLQDWAPDAPAKPQRPKPRS